MKRCLSLVTALTLSMLCFASQAPKIQTPSPEAMVPFLIAVSHVKQFYVKDASDDKLMAGAIRGMLQELDPHSSYLDEKALKQLSLTTKGNYVGVGMVLSVDHKSLKVITTLKDSPARKGGIKNGDYILAVNNKPMIDTDIDEAVEMIRGKPGTKVTLTVANKNDKSPRKITLTRKKLDVANITGRILSDHFAYIQIVQFQKNTARDIKREYQTLAKQAKLQGVILDLRNNPGGLLEEAVDVSDLFLDANKLGKDKTIVYTKERDNMVHLREKAKTLDMTQGLPIVVLINNGSASASEIVAGALQDYKRAVVIGTQSFGKGSVQTLLPLDGVSAIKLTTALYYTPKGRSIQATGIKPDITVEEMAFKEKDEKDEVLAFLTQMREKDLHNVLANGNGKSAEAKKAHEEISAEKDYQLHEAVNIIKAINLIKAQKAS
ncbi:MAG: peptidase S41 [Gammaproteobacteria bacterium CG11_big_fil_rev_8_21_14_0_20_46_22]|nr:MAG: peptidase S41 [Gammaproteobacteria bacterium CG12_big_fil_rev_8_21_14_0_65_46_12]PIR10861.1 MAG: peptidase S41 [Gammaproteobacteria bacterium CG11_big_fil_rev_8_21_14_0_20_46_22]